MMASVSLSTENGCKASYHHSGEQCGPPDSYCMQKFRLYETESVVLQSLAYPDMIIATLYLLLC